MEWEQKSNSYHIPAEFKMTAKWWTADIHYLLVGGGGIECSMQSVDPSKIIWSRMLLHCRWQVGVSVQEVRGPGEQMCPQSVSELGGPAVRIAFSSLGCLVWTGGELTPVCILQADFNLLHWQLELPLCFFLSPFLFHSTFSYHSTSLWISIFFHFLSLV